METLIIIFLIGFISAFIGSFVSGALCIFSLSLLLFFGIPPMTAFTTYHLSKIGFYFGSFFQYFKEKKIVWDLFWPITIATTIGTAIGTQIIVRVEEERLLQIVGCVLLLFVPILIWHKTLGIERQKPTRKKHWMGHFSIFLMGIWSGSFSIASGLFGSLSQMYFYGLTLLESKGTTKLPRLIASPIIVATFVWYDLVIWEYVISIILGTLLGSYLGVKYAVRFGDKNLKWILIISMIFFGVKFLRESFL